MLTATQSLNRYAYCEGNPISFLDPFGLSKTDTSEMHLIIDVATVFANGLAILFPEIGVPLSFALNTIDISLVLYDILSDITQKRGVDSFIIDISNLVFDILGFVSFGISKSATNSLLACESKVLNCNDTVWRGAEKHFRDIYNEYESLGKNMSGLTIGKCVKDIIKTLINMKKEG